MKPLSLSTKRLMLRRAIDTDSENLYRNYTSDTVCSQFLTRQPHVEKQKQALMMKKLMGASLIRCPNQNVLM